MDEEDYDNHLAIGMIVAHLAVVAAKAVKGATIAGVEAAEEEEASLAAEVAVKEAAFLAAKAAATEQALLDALLSKGKG